jgi:hypothetical protein
VRAHGAELDVADEQERRASSDARERERAWQRVLDAAYASIRSGLIEQGYGAIRQLIAQERGALEIYQWLFNRMLAWEDPRYAADLGARFVARLIEEGLLHTALELADQCGRLTPSFALAPEDVARLVAYARSIGRHRVADELAAFAAAPTP